MGTASSGDLRNSSTEEYEDLLLRLRVMFALEIGEGDPLVAMIFPSLGILVTRSGFEAALDESAHADI